MDCTLTFTLIFIDRLCSEEYMVSLFSCKQCVLINVIIELSSFIVTGDGGILTFTLTGLLTDYVRVSQVDYRDSLGPLVVSKFTLTSL